MMSLANGRKSLAVAVLGLISLLGVLVLVTVADGDSKLVVAAFTFLCSNVTTALGFMTGSTAPDQFHPEPISAGPVSPGLILESEATEA